MVLFCGRVNPKHTASGNALFLFKMDDGLGPGPQFGDPNDDLASAITRRRNKTSSSLGTNEIARHTPKMLATDEPVDDLETRLSIRFSQAMQKQQETMDAQQKELETLRAELERLQQATIKKDEIKKEPHEEASVDPEHGPFWSLAAIAVACWKSACWPKGKSWNVEKREFEDLPFERKLSPWEHAVKNLCWTVWYNVFPVIYTILFLCTLCAIMDEGNCQSLARKKLVG